MNTAARPLELRLKSEIDIEATEAFESQSKRSLAEQLRTESKSSRRRYVRTVAPLAVLAGIMLIWWFAA